MKTLKIKHLSALVAQGWDVERNIGFYTDTDLFRANIAAMDDSKLYEVMTALNDLLTTIRVVSTCDVGLQIKNNPMRTTLPPLPQTSDEANNLPIIDGDKLRTNTGENDTDTGTKDE